ncbi:MAG: EF-hand domain-containing protein [Thiohalorhabdaceae bacterium]
MRGLAMGILVLLLGIPGSALGAPKQLSEPDLDLPPFEQVDANDDGTITYGEVKDLGVPRKVFRREDPDRDGQLTRIDYRYGLK